MVGRKKISFFNDIKLRVLGKLSSWQHKCFSSRGKEVLIKAVAQAVPAYAMSVFRIPQGLCDDFEKAIAKFWWGSSNKHKGIHWARWERMCHAKIIGGLGFRDFSSFNHALLAKQGWRLLHNPESLMAKILKAKYFSHSGFMEAKLDSKPSFVWRSIIWGRELLQEGLRWRIGQGTKISACSKIWLRNVGSCTSIPPSNLLKDVVVADLINDINQWKEDKIAQLYPKEISERIVKLPLPKTPQEDILIWRFDKHGTYSVKSGYQLAVQLKFPENPGCSDISKSQWKVIWSTEIPEKVKIFMWRAAKNLLPTANNLWKKKVVPSLICQRCFCKSEDPCHALMVCKAARKVWKLTTFYDDVKQMAHQDMLSALQELALSKGKEDLAQIIAVCWAIWRDRNLSVLEGNQNSPQITAARATAIVESYRRIKQPKNPAMLTQRQSENKNWKPPPKNWFKVNVDAAVKMSDLQAARQAKCVPFIIESDSLEVVDLSKNRKRSMAEISWTIKEIQSSLKNQSQSSIQFVPRLCNSIAHSIAKVALEYEHPVLWLDDFPARILLTLSKFL